VVHYGDPALTWRAVRSLAVDSADLAALSRVLLVDNDPRRRLGDPPSDLPQALRDRLDIIVSPDNRGYAGGNNLALAKVNPRREPWFFVLNNDAEIVPGALATLLAKAESPAGASAVIFAPLILQSGPEPLQRPEDIIIWAAGGLVDLPRARAFNRAHGRRLIHLENFSIEPDADVEAWFYRARWRQIVQEPQLFVSGCSFLGRSRILRMMDGFDEGFFLYYEDADLCLRIARRFGCKPCRIVPHAVVWHEVSKGLGFSPLQEYYNWRNRGWFLRRHARGKTRSRGMAYLMAAAIAKATPRLNHPETRAHGWAILRGACRGLLTRVPKAPQGQAQSGSKTRES
jgi:N-acetylglucosaminyl-diphospho-decaprenol L-rhamnosyltransferase